jgi:hypothetical protein
MAGMVRAKTSRARRQAARCTAPITGVPAAQDEHSQSRSWPRRAMRTKQRRQRPTTSGGREADGRGIVVVTFGWTSLFGLCGHEAGPHSRSERGPDV